MKKLGLGILAAFIAFSAQAVTVELDKVVVQYVSEDERESTVFDAGELVRVTNNNDLVLGDGVKLGGTRMEKSFNPNVVKIISDDTTESGITNRILNGIQLQDAVQNLNSVTPDMIATMKQYIYVQPSSGYLIGQDLVFSNAVALINGTLEACPLSKKGNMHLSTGLGYIFTSATNYIHFTDAAYIRGCGFGDVKYIQIDNTATFADCNINTIITNTYNGNFSADTGIYITRSRINNGVHNSPGLTSAVYIRDSYIGMDATFRCGKGFKWTQNPLTFDDCNIDSTGDPLFTKMSGIGAMSVTMNNCNITDSSKLCGSGLTLNVEAVNTDFGDSVWQWTLGDTSRLLFCQGLDPAATNTAATLIYCTDSSGNLLPNQ